MSFWHTATDEQKLAQIDAAISLGLTSKQCAMNVGTKPSSVRAFASKHNRAFGYGSEAMRKIRQGQSLAGMMNSHKLFRAKMESRGLDIASAVSARIFPHHSEANLFDFHPLDDGAWQ